MSECPSWFARIALRKVFYFFLIFILDFKKIHNPNLVLENFLKSRWKKSMRILQNRSTFKKFLLFLITMAVNGFQEETCVRWEALARTTNSAFLQTHPCHQQKFLWFQAGAHILVWTGRQSCRESVGAAERGHCWALEPCSDGAQCETTATAMALHLLLIITPWQLFQPEPSRVRLTDWKKPGNCEISCRENKGCSAAMTLVLTWWLYSRAMLGMSRRCNTFCLNSRAVWFF